ncbi:uncharacterized protein LOC127714777 [Mytilus californianus]|uniref:uncharacterized protein LOC127714777 n=1 Tax=Mytilus californianus TaxID=6549 RepID=UPI0022462A08|nr:uncharacterized protein LOC127714777 [Mytilus californianus]
MSSAMTFNISTSWDGQPIDHDPVIISLDRDRCNNVIMSVDAPFFNDPANPGGTPGQPFPGLWDYEVAEAFFLNDQNDYLEVELSPHGQHLLLLLHGVRNSFKQQLPLTYKPTIKNDRWTGEATIPSSYFPPKVTKFNAYAIHGSGTNRTYESLYPVPTGKYKDPDFHKLDYFQPINFKGLLPVNWSPQYTSNEWKEYYPNMTYKISTIWDGQSIDHDPVIISLEKDGHNNVIMSVDAPFFNDPANPGGTPGQPFSGLWDYEVAEAFFLNDQNDYLEVELSPHGQHLLLLLHGVRKSFKQQLPLTYTATIKNDRWTGKATIPGSYFPPKVTKFNAYAIHGSGTNRTYESLYPVPAGKYTDPDFHKLDYFQPINFIGLLPGNWSPQYTSEEWKPYYPIVG